MSDVDQEPRTARPGGTCLVTGGAGFIGTAMSADLADRFDRVVAIDNLHPQIHPTRDRPADLADGVELVVADVTDTAAWDALLADVTPDVVVHLAAETGTGQSLAESTRHAMTNVVGTTQMLDALLRHEKLPRRTARVPGAGPTVRCTTRGSAPRRSSSERSGTSRARHRWPCPRRPSTRLR